MLFASFLIENEPMQWAELPRAVMTWVQVVGGIAALGTLLWFLAQFGQRRLEKQRLQASKAAILACAVSWIGFLAVGGLFIANYISEGRLAALMPTRVQPTRAGDLQAPPIPPTTVGDWLLTIAGGAALAAVLAPLVLAAATRLRFGRIWAMARLSLKEAVRSRVVLIFGAMALVFLFADWFVPYKPEDQVRNYVRVLYWSMSPLFLMTASLLGAFGIPSDVKSQAIHTIVTKPVEKFEIVLGRFLGYALLITIGLAAVSAVSMLYVFRGVTEEAKQESYTARDPLYAPLAYHGTEGEKVGRQLEVRRYITGPHPNLPGKARQYAVWTFETLPASLGAGDKPVQVEFAFDIFRLTKGVENQGVLCTFVFADGRLPVSEFERLRIKMKADFEQMQEAARKKAGGNPEAMLKAVDEINNALLEKYGAHVTAGFNVTDYHTQTIAVPAALFQHLRKAHAAWQPQAPGEPRPPLFQIAVSVDADTRGQNQQMLGIARRDLYVLAAENSFFMNFVKGIIGMWCLMMLVLGVAVACSTYLSGVISWLCTMFLIFSGMFVTNIQEMTENRPGTGGGPLESMVRLATRTPIAGPLDDTPATMVVTGVDEIYRFWLRLFLQVIPDVTRYELHPYVANGFDISWSNVLFLHNIVPLVGYLFPWAILAFYLMKYREIANPM